MDMELQSKAFQQGQTIPKDYTADGANQSPPLKWSGVPPQTKSLALICEDPDAPRGTFTHWVLFNIAAECRELGLGVPAQGNLPDGAIQGRNGFGKIGYGGPSPPPGKPHRYFFKLYALDKMLDLQAGAAKDDLLAAMKDHVLADGQLMGVYSR